MPSQKCRLQTPGDQDHDVSVLGMKGPPGGVLSRDSPDESQTGINVRVFPALLQDRREVLTATSTSGSPNGGRVADLAIFPGIWTHSFCRLLLSDQGEGLRRDQTVMGDEEEPGAVRKFGQHPQGSQSNHHGASAGHGMTRKRRVDGEMALIIISS